MVGNTARASKEVLDRAVLVDVEEEEPGGNFASFIASEIRWRASNIVKPNLKEKIPLDMAIE